MNAAPAAVVATVSNLPWKRLHRALMPDYSRKAAAYWWAMVLLGGSILLHTLRSLSLLAPAELLQVGS